MRNRRVLWTLAAPLLWGCGQFHRAEVRSAAFPPPLAQPVLHSNRLWIELSPATLDQQCIQPKLERKLCFEEIHAALAGSLAQSLWTTFPRVDFRERGDEVSPADYVLVVDLKVDGLAPDQTGPGWSARAKGKWQLYRDGQALAGEEVSVRSRPEFGYGRPLGIGAGEALGAIAAHVAAVLGAVPESRPLSPVPLPEVVASPLPGSQPEAPASPVAEPAPAAAPVAEPAPATEPAPPPAVEPAPEALPVTPQAAL